jgi:large subunit ribosomal protein L5
LKFEVGDLKLPASMSNIRSEIPNYNSRQYRDKIKVMSTTKYTPRLADKYKNEVVPALVKKFGYKTVMQAPRLEKIAINRGVNGAVNDKKLVDIAVDELTNITGQKAVPTFSKKDISNFKLRKGMPIGARVTLRGEKMYEFLDRLIAVALPRVRDFKGISDKAFDGRGNYTLGVTEQIIFPEVDIDKVNKITGMDITFVTTADTNEEAYELLKELGMPFKNIQKDQQ